MALIRCNEAATKPRIFWIPNHGTAQAGFYDEDGNLVETTGGSFTNNRGLTMAYTSNDNWNVTNAGTEDLLILNGSTSSATPTVLSAGQTKNTVNFPVVLMPAGTT